MSRQNIRDYEISIWTLQDSFITVLGTAAIAHKGQLIDPKLKISTDGIQSLDFSIPIKYREGNELVDNPLWYNLTNGAIVVDLRKIKVIFNKQKPTCRVYEFVINKVTEEHDGGQLIAHIEATGLAFQELGHTGYKLAFSQESFELEYEEWFEAYSAGEKSIEEEPVATLDYWARKVFDQTNWNYRVQMDWSSYDGIMDDASRQGRNVRQPDKVYEDEYVKSWESVGQQVVPTDWEQFTEKARIINAEKSNRYNITQDIAEAFGVFCRYEYDYDDNFHIIGRTCVFYNNFFDETLGKLDINYPYDISNVSREMDSSDLVTKMFVVPLDDDTQPSGEISIANETANFSLEDYILNFEYLHLVGTISEEQYQAVGEYTTRMAILNRQLVPCYDRLNEIIAELPNQKALESTHHTAQSAAEDRISAANAAINSLVGKDETLEKTNSNPEGAIFLSASDGTYYLSITHPGVLGNTIHIYAKYLHGSVSQPISTTGMKIERDASGNIVKLTNFSAATVDKLDSKKCFLTYSYQPFLQYKNIVDTYNTVLAQEMKAEQEAAAQIQRLEAEQENLEVQIKDLLEQKQDASAYFERLMGPALKEGSWTPEDYKDYGNKYIEAGNFTAATVTEHLEFLWDNELFEGEQKDYEEEKVTHEKHYYPVILLPNSIYNSGHLSDLRFFYQDSNGADKTLTIDANMFYAFYSNYNSRVAAIILEGAMQDFDQRKDYALGYVTTALNSDGTTRIDRHVLVNKASISFILPQNYRLVYPRIHFKTEKLKVSDDNLIVMAGSEKLEKYLKYSLTYRGLTPYISIKPNQVILQGIETEYTINFTISNASLSLYLDALQVAQENAFPQVSYTVKVENASEIFLRDDYMALGRLVNINDVDLHFENVQGYVSEIELSLDSPWDDELTIQNYKNKFEDLFQRIVASSEQMKTNSVGYDRAASAITTNGGIVASYIQTALNQVDLNYQFMNGNLTIDEINGIWARSDSGVVALRGGGLFTSNQRDSFGNWVWNTAITPSGINASLLTSGQLDTNMIKVYAGGNVAFQLNGQGLYAYRAPEGIPTVQEYVVHNGEGLFLVNEEGTPLLDENGNPLLDDDDNPRVLDQIINRVEISWDGLILRDLQNEKVFYADTNGNLYLTGNINANGGQIGQWTIEDNQLSSTIEVADPAAGGILTYSSVGFNSQGDGIIYDLNGDPKTTNNVFWINNNAKGNSFRIDNLGNVFADSIVANQIVATTGVIGNINVEDLSQAIKGIRVATLLGDTFFVDGTDILSYTIIPSAIQAEKQLLYGLPTSSESGYTIEYSYGNETDSEKEWFYITADDTDLISISDIEHLTFNVHRAIVENEDSVQLRFTAWELDGVSYSEVAQVYNITESGEGESPYSIALDKTELLMAADNNAIVEDYNFTLTASCFRGQTDITDNVTLEVEEIDSSIEYSIAGQTITIDFARDSFSPTASSGTFKVRFKYNSIYIGTKIVQWILIQNGAQGDSGIFVQIESSNGNQFSHGSINTRLTCRIYSLDGEIDAAGTLYHYTWTQRDRFGNIVPSFSREGKTINLTSEDITMKATFSCEINKV